MATTSLVTSSTPTANPASSSPYPGSAAVFSFQQIGPDEHILSYKGQKYRYTVRRDQNDVTSERDWRAVAIQAAEMALKMIGQDSMEKATIELSGLADCSLGASPAAVAITSASVTRLGGTTEEQFIGQGKTLKTELESEIMPCLRSIQTQYYSSQPYSYSDPSFVIDNSGGGNCGPLSLANQYSQIMSSNASLNLPTTDEGVRKEASEYMLTHYSQLINDPIFYHIIAGIEHEREVRKLTDVTLGTGEKITAEAIEKLILKNKNAGVAIERYRWNFLSSREHPSLTVKEKETLVRYRAGLLAGDRVWVDSDFWAIMNQKYPTCNIKIITGPANNLKCNAGSEFSNPAAKHTAYIYYNAGSSQGQRGNHFKSITRQADIISRLESGSSSPSSTAATATGASSLSNPSSSAAAAASSPGSNGGNGGGTNSNPSSSSSAATTTGASSPSSSSANSSSSGSANSSANSSTSSSSGNPGSSSTPSSGSPGSTNSSSSTPSSGPSSKKSGLFSAIGATLFPNSVDPGNC